MGPAPVAPVAPRGRGHSRRSLPPSCGPGHRGAQLRGTNKDQRIRTVGRSASHGRDLPAEAHKPPTVRGGQGRALKTKMVRKGQAAHGEKSHRPPGGATPSCACVCLCSTTTRRGTGIKSSIHRFRVIVNAGSTQENSGRLTGCLLATYPSKINSTSRVSTRASTAVVHQQ